MRGGTSKGVFFSLEELPNKAQVPGHYRDNVLLRVIGSPDPYGKQTDGMGGATSSTSKIVIVSKSDDADHDVNYEFGQVSIDKPFVDWSGNCGNLTAAVGAFAIHKNLLDEQRVPKNGIVEVRVWQVNIKKTILVSIPVINASVQETGDFFLDGVTFPSAEISVSFMDPVDGVMFPTGNVVDELTVPSSVVSSGKIRATLINAGIPTIFVDADDLGYSGTELQEDINSDSEALRRFEILRAHGALAMGLINSLEEAETRQHTPKVAFVAPPKTYSSSSGESVDKSDIQLLVRALSMGKLHHAMMGTAAVAIGTAAAVPGTLVQLATGDLPMPMVNFGHPSGTLRVGAEASFEADNWQATRVVMSRSARRLMEGSVFIPEP
jgi:probable AcnD-accessory protein PrpF